MKKFYLLFLLSLVIISSYSYAWFNGGAIARNPLLVEDIAGGNLVNFPFPIIQNMSNFAKSCIDPQIVNISTSDNELLAYEFENNTCLRSNLSIIWARAPELTQGTNTTFNMYHNLTTPFDNSSANRTWMNYTGVYHMGDISPTQQLNSKGGSMANGTIAGDCSSNDGKFGMGISCNGTSTAAGTGLKIVNGWSTTNGANTENITYEFWFKSNRSTASNGIFSLYQSASQFVMYIGQGTNKNQTRIFMSGGIDITPAATYTINQWHYIVVSYDGHIWKTYLDGTNVNLSHSTADLVTTTSDMFLGGHGLGGVTDINGTVDEFRITFLNVSKLGGDAYVNETWNTQNGVTVGATVIRAATLSVNITSPVNYTLLNYTQLLNFTIISSANTTANCTYQLDAGSFNQLGIITNNTANVTLTTFTSDRLHNYTVACNDNFANASSTVWFTLFAQNYLYFHDTTTNSLLSGFNVYSAESGINTTVSGTMFNMSSNNLTAGSNTFILSLYGYGQNSTVIIVNRTLGFNVTINTTQTIMTIQAVDEITRQQLPFNLDMYLKGTNTTLYRATAFKAGNPCFYDGDTTTACITEVVGSANTFCMNESTVQAFDYTNATFNLKWDLSIVSGAGSASVSILAPNLSVIYLSVNRTSAGTFNEVVNLTNDNSQIGGRAINLTVLVCASSADANGKTAVLYEFRQNNNTGGYYYVTNNTIAIPSLITTGFTTLDSWFKGEETYLPDYSTARMYRLSFSSLSDFSLTGYLLNSSAGYLQYFTVLDPNNVPISDALITIQNWYSGIATTVVQCASNPTGSCAVFVRKYVEYLLVAQKTGYNIKNLSVVFTGLPNPANLYLSGNTASNYTSVFNGIALAIAPSVENQNSSFNTTCSITAANGNLNFMNYTIYRVENNTFYLYNSTYSSSVPTGSTFKMPILNRGRYSAVCTLQWVSNATGTTTIYQTSFTQPYWSFHDNGQGIGSTATDSVMGLGIYILLVLVVCLPLSRINPAMAMFAGIGILLACAFTGILTWNTLLNGVPANLGWYLAGLTILVVIALFSMRNRV